MGQGALEQSGGASRVACLERPVYPLLEPADALHSENVAPAGPLIAAFRARP
jgi:hypothetical protein